VSFYDDYVAEGLCCQVCGAYLGDEPGYARFCDGCKEYPDGAMSEAQRRRKGRKRRPETIIDRLEQGKSP